MQNIDGINYLIRNNPNLHNKINLRDKNKMSRQEIITTYLEKLEKIEKKCLKRKKYLSSYKKWIIAKYVTRFKDISSSYYEKEAKMFLDRGYGFIDLDDDIKYEMYSFIKKEQETSLAKWLDYLIINDNNYPEWFLYLCIESITKVGNVNYNNFTYNRRTKDTISPFIELNKEALSLTYSYIKKHFNKEKIQDEELEELIKRASFNKIYFYFIWKIIEVIKKRRNSTEGIWKEYIQGSDPNILVSDIEGKGTGWCIAGFETAKLFLEAGKLDIYFTKDSSGEYTIPRIAIRKENERIVEIRGILEEQEVESELTNVLEEKLKEDNSYTGYQDKINNLNKLKEIYERDSYNNLTDEELVFLYELEKPISTFGNLKDPRIDMILQNRDKKKDISRLLNIDEEDITTNIDDLLIKKNIKIFIGDICSSNSIINSRLKYLKNLEMIIGDVEIFEYPHNIILPKKVIGSVFINTTYKIERIVCPEYVSGCLDLTIFESLNYLDLPKLIGIYFYYYGTDGTLNIINISRDYYYDKINNKEAKLLLER